MRTKARYLFASEVFADIEGKLRKARCVVLFLDYDGTLTPLRPTPQEAIPSPRAVELLQKLHKLPHMHIVLLTGRGMQDIRSLFSYRPHVLAANHGFEIFWKEKHWIHSQAKIFAEKRKTLLRHLYRALKVYEGVTLEDKVFSLTIHYRNAPSSKIPEIKKIVKALLETHGNNARLTKGKKVLELRPQAEWGKGHALKKALTFLRLRLKPLLVAIGDDKTDEAMFEQLESTNITICVGRKQRTGARLYVRNVEEVLKFLERVLSVRLQERSKKHENTGRL